MEQTKAVVEKVLSILSEFDNAIDIAMIVCICLLNRKVTKSIATSPLTSAISSPTSDTSVSLESKTVPVKNLKANTKAEMLKALDVYYSSKDDSELSDEEKTLVDKVTAFMNGGSDAV